MKLNDLNEASFAGAALSKLGDKLRGRPEGKMSMADKMAQQQFSEDLIGSLSAGLAHGISGNTINPDPTAGLQSAAPAPAPSSPAAPVASAQDEFAQKRIAKQQAAAKAADSQAVPVPKTAPAQPPTPAQVRQQKQADAAKSAQASMTPAPAKPAPVAQPAAATLPTGSKQLGPKGRETLARLGKQKQVRASGPQQSLDLNENYSMLDYVFESIMSLDEAGEQYPYTISTYVQNFMKKYMGDVDTSSIKAIADEVQATYAKDRGRKALTKLASAAYSLYHTGGSGTASQSAPAGQSSSPISTALDALTGSSTPSSSATGTAPAAEPSPLGQSTPPDTKTVYKQVKELMKSLNKQQKGFILRNLEKQLGTSMPAANKPTQSTSAPEPTKNFGLQNNYGKTTMNVPTGIPQSIPSGNRASKVNQKRKAMSPVSESKKFKTWGTGNESK